MILESPEQGLEYLGLILEYPHFGKLPNGIVLSTSASVDARVLQGFRDYSGVSMPQT